MKQAYKLRKICESMGFEPRVIVEAGAMDCKESVLLAELFPKATVHAFECNPRTLPECREREKNSGGRIVLHEIGLHRFECKGATMNLESDNGSSSLLKIREGSASTCTCVDISRLDSLGIFPDMMWLDAQGSELDILHGSDLNNTKLIHVEVYFREAYHFQPLYEDIRRHLNLHGFYLHSFTWRGRQFGDAVFVKGYRLQWPVELWSWAREKVTGWSRRIMTR